MSGPEGTFDRWLARIPDPFLFVLVLTLVTAGLALLQPGVTVGAVVDAWGNGLGGLLAFTTQIALTLLLAHALGHTDAMTRLLGWVARLPQSPRGGLCRGLPRGQRPEFAGLVPGARRRGAAGPSHGPGGRRPGLASRLPPARGRGLWGICGLAHGLFRFRAAVYGYGGSLWSIATASYLLGKRS